MKLMRKDNQIIRVLKLKDEKVLVIDCVKRTMPVWIAKTLLNDYVDCDEDELYELTGMNSGRELTGTEQKVARERFTMIAGVLPFIAEQKKRNEMVDALAVNNNCTKQTIRKYLCLYLVYQNVSVLAPAEIKEKELNVDQKNMRWSLNKFFYNKDKNSLKNAYTMMLKEKYCDSEGNLLDKYPSFYQYRYFYRTHKNMQQFYISRDGIKHYQRVDRPLLGEGVQQYCPTVGYSMLDSTTLDIYLVDDAGQVVGRPILTFCVDGFSGLIQGYSLTWEGGMYSLRNLMMNVVSNKVDWCERKGVLISKNQWDSCQLPSTLITDMGTEYKGENLEQLTDLGIKIVNLQAFRPDLKGTVERTFQSIQNLFKCKMKGMGVVEADYMERTGRDYRKDSCITMEEMEKIILHCIVYYNSQLVVENFPYTDVMIEEKVKPYRSEIYNWGKQQMGVNLLNVDSRTLMLVMMPRTTGKFTRKGLMVNGLRYKHPNYIEDFLKGKEVVTAYNPENVAEVWVIENGSFVPFELIESRFEGKSLDAVSNMNQAKRQLVKNEEYQSLQAKIQLAEQIETIVGSKKRSSNVGLKNIRNTRQREKERCHIDFMKESVN